MLVSTFSRVMTLCIVCFLLCFLLCLTFNIVEHFQRKLKLFVYLIVELNNESTDTTRLESNLRSGWNAIHQRIPLAAETIASVHAILIEEQRAEIVEKMERRKDRREKRLQRRGHHWYREGSIMI